MTSITMKKTNVGITVFAALLISSFAALFAGNQAHAASYYAGPIYNTYAECEAARPSFQSSWTSPGPCQVTNAYDTVTSQVEFLGYSFFVHSL